MEQVYELSLDIGDEDANFYVEHRFPSLPERETLIALKDEAIQTWTALFPTTTADPAQTIVRLYLLPLEERDRETTERVEQT